MRKLTRAGLVAMPELLVPATRALLRGAGFRLFLPRPTHPANSGLKLGRPIRRWCGAVRAYRRSANSLVFALVALALGIPTHSARAGAGDLDPTFGVGGQVITPMTGTVRCSSLAVQPDGKLIVAGSHFLPGGPFQKTTQVDILLVRYNTDGSLDTTFGTGGIVITDMLGTSDEANAVKVQPDGKIVIAGSMSTPDTDFALLRYNPDGGLDLTFGHGGKVVTGMGGQDSASDVVLLPNGKLVAVGASYRVSIQDAKIAIARYLSDGVLDVSLNGGQGKLLTEIDGWGVVGNAAALQNDGKIVVAGTTVGPLWQGGVALARYDTYGSPDWTFGTHGVVTTTVSPYGPHASDLALQDDGKIVVAGSASAMANANMIALRYNADGTADSSFGDGGKVAVDVSGSDDSATAVALQPDGKLLLAGTARWNLVTRNFELFRLTAQGTLDQTFGFDGRVSTDFGGQDDAACDVVVQPDGRIVVAGTSWQRLVLARYLSAPPRLPRRAWLPVVGRQ